MAAYLYVPEKGGDPLISGLVFGGMTLTAAVTFGLFFALGRITDAITDPLVAYWSDHLVSKRGRRIPFVLWGTPPFVIVFFLMWTPPTAEPSLTNALFVFALIQAYFILYTIVVAPYLALIPEIVSDPKRRVNLTTLQAIFVMIGTLLFGASGAIIENFGWTAMAAGTAVLSALTLLPTVLFIREPEYTPPAQDRHEPLQLWRWVKLTLKNPAFFPVALSTSFYWFALNTIIVLIPYWVEGPLGLGKDSATVVMLPFLGVNLVFFFVFNFAAKRFGKYAAFMIVLIGTGLCAPLFWLVGTGVLPGSPLVQTAVVMALIGMPSAGFMMLPFAIISDVADYDERLTGLRREAIFFGTQAIFQKSAIALSIPVFGALAYLGGDGSAVTEGGLKLAAGLAGVASLLGAAAFWKYPLRESDGGLVVKE